MIIIDEPQVTVGQIVKDLQEVVKKNPDAIPTYGGAITSYISGIRFLKKGLLLLEESEDWKTLTKYNTKESYGKVDNVKQLELSDDAAHQILGGGWQMPTAKEAKELEDNCSWERMTIKGVEGWKYKSKIKGYTDKWIFFPDTGHKAYDMLCTPDEGFYWTSSLYTRRPDCGLTVFCNSIYEGKVDRFDGMCIRPVTK